MATKASKEDRPGAQRWMPEDRSEKSLRTAVADCRGCELYRDATQAVFGEGDAVADLMLVGEQPGDHEDREGHPFVGPAGKLLDRALDEAGIEPERVYRTNVVKHFRFSDSRGKQRIHQSPSLAHMRACAPWLMAEIDLVRPVGVLLLGGTAGKALYGSSFRVGEARGLLSEWPQELRDVVRSKRTPDWVSATTHLSAVLRSRERDTDYARSRRRSARRTVSHD